jgi:hypothetical protein
MAGTLTVQNLQGPSSGANANKIIIPSGQTLYAAGHVLQVVQTDYATETTLGSSTFTDTGLSGSITPTSASSNILVVCNLNSAGVQNSSGADAKGRYRVLRNTTEVLESLHRAYDYGNSGTIIFGSFALSVLDSPATTSPVTYKVQQILDAGSSIRVNEGGGGTRKCTLTLMEIAQ